MKIDVIIPTYKPGKELFDLLDKLKNQTVPVQNIILMNTEKEYFDELVKGSTELEKYPNVQVHHLAKQEFDHGGTRRRAVTYSDADIFICMTQDAMPYDEFLVERLTANLKGDVAASYARQIPLRKSSELEKIARLYNYPPRSRIKTEWDTNMLGAKIYFCSNVCAAYRRDLYEELGGFISHTIFNEDMIYAAAVIKGGYAISYEAKAYVLHSHNYTLWQQLRRNFDMGVSHAQHWDIFCPSLFWAESEGKRLERSARYYMIKKKELYLYPAFIVQCGFKYVGFWLGKHYRRLPRKMVLALTTNKEYWN